MSVNPIQMGIFGAAPGWGGPKRFPVLKSVRHNITLIKLVTLIPDLKKIQKVYESRDTSLEFW